ncbi:MAG: hypothetical protein LBU67_04310 [Oscillospiraceae bacterium]|jgi:hypothetical protein|nr:hypothetical protein [Oscillospiraceae bacterium]
MDVDQAFRAALSTLPYPTTQVPSTGKGSVYLAWQELLQTGALYAGNRSLRTEHMVQVSVYSLQPLTGDHLREIKRALRDGGIHVGSLEPEN